MADSLGANSGSREPSPKGLGPAGFDPGRFALFMDGSYFVVGNDTDAAIAASHDDFLRLVTVDDLIGENADLRGELLMAQLAFRRIAQGPGISGPLRSIATARADLIAALLTREDGLAQAVVSNHDG